MSSIFNFFLNSNKKIFLNTTTSIFIFLILFLVGLNVYKDFGISIDEIYHRENGKLYYFFLKGIFINLDLSEKVLVSDIRLAIQDVPFTMPAIFDMIAEFYIDIRNLNKIEDVFFVRHFLNFFIFLVACYFFYRIILKIFKNHLYAYLGLFFLFFSPRFFAESFYNNKDIIFLSVTIIYLFFTIKFFDNKNFYNAFLFGLFSALALVIRIPASIYIFATYLIFLLQIFDDKKFLALNYKFLTISIFTTIIFIYIFWPYLWIDPINHIIHFFKIARTVMPNGQNFYLGEYFQYKNSPWHYDFIWIVITIPISITIFFIVGFTRNFIKITKNFLSVDNKNHKFWSSYYEMLNYLFFIICFLVLFLKIKFGVSYDGWRQIYFLYPFIILVAIYGINYIIEVIKISRLKNILFLFFFIELIYSCFWIYKYHPHQYVFFNPLFKNYVYEKIELDYWGLSNRSALEFISNSDERNEIKIATVSFTSLENTLYIMNKNDRKKFIVVHDLYSADYVIDNYRKKWNKTPGIDLMETEFKKIYDLKIDGVIISSIYKGEK